MAKMAGGAADARLAKAEAALEKGDSKTAQHEISILLTEFPDEPAADEASKLLVKIEASEEERRTESVEDRTEEVAKLLAPIEKRHEKAVQKNMDGLRAGKSTSKMRKNFETSMQESQRAYDALAKLKKKHGDDPQFMRAATALEGEIEHQYVQTSLNLASIYLTRGSLNRAMGIVNEVLAMAPKNPEAMAMRARIESAANNNSWGGWVIAN
jgi:Zn-dependent M16 (insulinase) family peptidase